MIPKKHKECDFMKKGTLGYCIIAGVLIIGCAVFFIGRKIRNRQEKTDTAGIVESEDGF